jgi:thioredoxin 1
MTKVFDIPLASSDLSLDRVLGAGLPVAMVFYEKDLTANLRLALDDQARQYAGKVLIITLARSDAPQAASRFGISRFPTLVTVRDGKPVTRQEEVRPEDLKPHLAHLAGEGPAPGSRKAEHPVSGPKQAPAKGPVNINEAEFEREVLRADRPVLVDLWAPWCGPCHMVAPTLEALAREHPESLKVVKINVDENPAISGRYGVMGIPTMIVFNGGREVDRWTGALP